MTCSHCGKELVVIAELEDEEIKDFEYLLAKERSADTALQSDIIEVKDMTPDQVYSYFLSAHTLKAESDFLRRMFFRNIREKYGLVDFDFFIEDNKIVKHAEEGR